MKSKLIVVLILVAITGFGVWCYYPHQDVNKIAFKMKVPLPGLHSRCVSLLGQMGIPKAIDLLLTEFHSDIRARRVMAAKALGKAEWQPSDDRERALYFVASGKYQAAVDLGSVAIEPLIEEFRQVKEATVRSRLCAILLKTGDKKALETIEGYIRRKLDKIGAIIREAMPTETRVSATMEEVSASIRRIVIAGHLLEGAKPDDKSPYVRGEYGTRESLEAKAKYRTYEIYRSIFRDVPMAEFHSVVVECRHGVRVQIVPFGSPVIPGSDGTDQAMTIFKTSLAPEAAQKLNWQNATLSDVEKVWTVESNVIPSLQFIAVPGFR